MNNQRRRGVATTAQCWQLHLAGQTVTEIAVTTGLTKGGVSKALRRGELMVRDELRKDVLTHRATTLARLQLVFAEACEAWEYSKAGVTKRRSRHSQGVRYESIEHTNTPGDPRYLSVALRALEDIAKLLGLNAEPADSGDGGDRVLKDTPQEQLIAELEDLLRRD